jgi:hypothetical protein
LLGERPVNVEYVEKYTNHRRFPLQRTNMLTPDVVDVNFLVKEGSCDIRVAIRR